MQLTGKSNSHLGLSTQYLTLKERDISIQNAVRTQNHFSYSGPITQPPQSSRRRSRRTPSRTTRHRPRLSTNNIPTQENVKRFLATKNYENRNKKTCARRANKFPPPPLNKFSLPLAKFCHTYCC